MIDLISKCNNIYGFVGMCSSIGKVFLNVHVFLCIHHAHVLYPFRYSKFCCISCYYYCDHARESTICHWVGQSQAQCNSEAQFLPYI